MPLITFWSECLGNDDEWIGLFLPLWFNSFGDFNELKLINSAPLQASFQTTSSQQAKYLKGLSHEMKF
jgi:hypothetical protein